MSRLANKFKIGAFTLVGKADELVNNPIQYTDRNVEIFKLCYDHIDLIHGLLAMIEEDISIDPEEPEELPEDGLPF